jgi:hypothetical protein
MAQEVRRNDSHGQAHPNPTLRRQRTPGVVHTSLYLPEATYEGLRFR